jgi:hypothetical protein
MKIKSSMKYRILCDYGHQHDRLRAGDIVEVDRIVCMSSRETHYGLIYFKNSFPILMHIFESIAEEARVESRGKSLYSKIQEFYLKIHARTLLRRGGKSERRK